MTDFLINACVNLFIVFGILLILAFIAGTLKILSEFFKDWAEEREADKKIPIEQLKAWQIQYGNSCTYGTIMKLVEAWERENNEID